MTKQNESPPVTEIRDVDVLGRDVDEQTGEGYWMSSRNGPVGSLITAADRGRVGEIAVDTFELSLRWLDDVIVAGQLDSFVRLGKVCAAVGGRDHTRAVDDGWGICELRCRARLPNLPHNIHQCINELKAAGSLDGQTADRLQALRVTRNNWAHGGAEPGRPAALEALALATLMLGEFVPGLTTRVVDGWRSL